jgi:hypothetical protein
VRRWLVAALVLAGCGNVFDLDRVLSDAREPDAAVDAGEAGDASPGKDAEVDAGRNIGADASTEGCASSFGANPLQFKNYPYTWTMASDYCKSLQVASSSKYAHLAVIDSQTELDAVALLGISPWVGLTNVGGWRYVTNQPTTATPWQAGHPDGTGTNNCAYAATSGNENRLVSALCTETHGFVCECDDYPPVL